MTLVGRHHDFVLALRRAGLTVSVAEDLDAARVLTRVDLLEREQLRAAYAATLVKRHTDRAAFDTLFELYFPARRDDAAAGPAPAQPAGAPSLRRDDPELVRFRAELAAALRDGDDRTLAGLARAGVTRFGGVPGRGPGTGTWSAYGAATRISPQTLLHDLLEQALHGRERGGVAERVARARFEQRIERFRALLDTEVQGRLAAEKGPAAVARTAVGPGVERLDLLSATRADLVAIRREIQPLARRLAARLAVQQRHGRRGHLDFRRTIRSSLSTGGIPMQPSYRPPTPRRTELVILCDLSESVSSFAHFTLLLVHALREQFGRVRVFAFIDELDEVTGSFRPGTDAIEAVAHLAATAKVRGWSGRTDYGRAFELFHQRHLDAITPRAALLVLGDARSNHGDPGLRALRGIAGRARRAHWLNPERRSAWDTGDSVAGELGRIVPMVECRNLAQLGGFVRDLV